MTKLALLKRAALLSAGYLIIYQVWLSYDTMTFEPAEFDEYCDEIEWMSFNNRTVFIKRSAVFYLPQLDLLRLHMIIKTGVIFKPSITVSDRVRVKYNLYTTWSVAEYSLVNLDAVVNKPVMSTGALKVNINGLQLPIKLIYLGNNNKTGAMICTKCLHIDNRSIDSLDWWLQLNRQIGYERVSMCNHSIDSSFHALFQKFNSFIQLSDLKCIPNLQTSNDKYFNSYTNLTFNKEYFVYKFELINQLILNECYMNNMERYEHIAVIDIDEAILPKQKLSKLVNLEIEASCAAYNIGSYLTDLYKNGAKQNVSLYFRQAFYLPDAIMAQAVVQLDQLVGKNRTRLNTILPINYTRYDPRTKIKHQLVFSFTIQSQKEWKYALRVASLYKNLVARVNVTAEDQFNRGFFITGPLTNNRNGKTLVNTDHALDLNIHVPESSFKSENGRYIIERKTSGKNAFSFLDHDLGQLSHFRSSLNFDYTHIPFESVYFDTDYFKCGRRVGAHSKLNFDLK